METLVKDPTAERQLAMRTFYDMLETGERGLLIVRSGMGGGKTFSMLRLAKHVAESAPDALVAVITLSRMPASELARRFKEMAPATAIPLFFDLNNIDLSRSLSFSVLLVDEAQHLQTAEGYMLSSRLRQAGQPLLMALFGEDVCEGEWQENYDDRMEIKMKPRV